MGEAHSIQAGSFRLVGHGSAYGPMPAETEFSKSMPPPADRSARTGNRAARRVQRWRFARPGGKLRAMQTQEADISNIPQRRGGSLWAAIVVGLALSIPVGWFLAYLAALPAFMGLFFFMLIGLLVGAFVDRVRGGARISRAGLWRLGIAVTLTIWLTSLYSEYRQIPDEIVTRIRDESNRTRVADPKALQTATQENFQRLLAEHHAPGGFVGYLRWAAVDGTMSIPRVIGSGELAFELAHSRAKWLIRNVLSLVLMGAAVLSQVLRIGEGQPAPNVLLEAREQTPL